jgi:phage/plasmid-like protein (TIGR03299 family)
MSNDVNVQFREEKQGQIAQARAIVERNRADIASYDSGATQAEIDKRLADQVAEGKVRMVGPDRYEVLEGWDRNEIFSVQRATRPGEIPLILPETGLDYVNGEAQLYLAKPEWHGLGSVFPGGTSDIATVLRKSGGSYGVKQAAVRYKSRSKLLRKTSVREMPGHFVNYRDDTGDPLGVVGGIYTPIQNREAMSFLQEMAAGGDAIIDSAGPMRGGRKFFVCMRLPEDVAIDVAGVNDIITPYVAVINSHDGSSPLLAVATPWNIVCGNTERFAVRDAYTRWSVRHTKTALDRIAEARRTLGLSSKYFERFAAEEEQLARTAILLDDFDKLIAELWPVKDTPDGKQPHHWTKDIPRQRRDALHAGFAKDAERVGQTAYAAERAVTDWLDHAAPRRAIGGSMAAARATAVLEGSSDDLKSKAHKRLLTLAS